MTILARAGSPIRAAVIEMSGPSWFDDDQTMPSRQDAGAIDNR
jgi:hypothetical protein